MMRPRTLTAYRLLTGPDDSRFCHKVTRALSEGWQLYGQPSISFDAASGQTICAQAVIKDVEGVGYSEDLQLGDLSDAPIQATVKNASDCSKHLPQQPNYRFWTPV